MTLKEDISSIRTHIEKMNDELGGIETKLATVKNELKWHKWVMLSCLVLILALFGLNVKMPAPFLAGGLSILSFGIR